MPYYHCTDLESAKLIETGGFTSDYSLEPFSRYADVYAELYGPVTRDRITMISRFLEEAKRHRNDEGVALWKKEIEEFRRRWISDWGHGTMIWTSPDEENAHLFGEACFEVSRPPGARDVIRELLWWVPESPMPARYFKRVS
jgi:hypothetical protein